MPVQVDWHQSKERVIRQHVSGDWETQEWFDAAETAVQMAQDAPHEVAVIVDYADDVDVNRVPDGLLRALIELREHPFVTNDNISCVAVVGLSGQLAQVDRIFQRLHQQRKSVRVDTLEDAVRIVENDLLES